MFFDRNMILKETFQVNKTDKNISLKAFQWYKDGKLQQLLQFKKKEIAQKIQSTNEMDQLQHLVIC